MLRACLSVLLLVLSAGVVAMAVPPGQPGQPGGPAVLETKEFFRCFMTWQTEQVRAADGHLAPIEMVGEYNKTYGPAKVMQTPLPPGNWADPDFNDAAWARFQGPIPTGSRGLAVLCVRGKFQVADPAKVGDLTLGLTFRGGAIVYLNGKQVARKNMGSPTTAPEAGGTTLAYAEDYPREAYVDPAGKLLRSGFGDPEKYKDRFALRERKIEELKLPANMLRKGLNVLAVEVHRSAISEVFITGQAKDAPASAYSLWPLLQLAELKLIAPAGSAVTAVGVGSGSPEQPGQPALRVWSHSVLDRVSSAEYGDPNDDPKSVPPVVIVGCRNGAFSGQFVVGPSGSSMKSITGLKVEAGPLDAVGQPGAAGAAIPATAVQVRYVQPNRSVTNRPLSFDSLEEAAPAEVVPEPGAGSGRGARADGGSQGQPIQPVWLTVRVPADAKPGEYAGQVTVTAAGSKSPIVVPVKLKVIDFLLPDSKQFCSHVGLLESPDSVAMQYGVPLWSEDHWKHLEKIFALFGQVGEDDVFIPLICGTYLGNQQSMVRWVKQGDGYTPNFTVAERYLDLVVKYLGKPPVVCLYVWDRNGGTWGPTSKDLGGQKTAASVTLIDPAQPDKAQRMDAPKWGTPESVPFWKPAFDGMRERLKKRGLESSMMVGTALDHRPMKITVDDLNVLAPGCKWVVHSHMAGSTVVPNSIIGYGAHVWCSYRLVDPAIRRPKPWWQNQYIFTGFPRGGVGGVGPIYHEDLPVYRLLLEGLMACGHNGVGRVGADFWPCRKMPNGRTADLVGGDAGDTSVTLYDSSTAVLAPGRSGPISTQRFEMLREGAQEAEARAIIEKALADPAIKAKLGNDLAGRAQTLLDDRVRMMVQAMGQAPGPGSPSDWRVYCASPWQQEMAKLFALAGEVQRSAEGQGPSAK